MRLRVPAARRTMPSRKRALVARIKVRFSRSHSLSTTRARPAIPTRMAMDGFCAHPVCVILTFDGAAVALALVKYSSWPGCGRDNTRAMSRDRAIQLAYDKFVEDMHVHGRSDIASAARVPADCWDGAAQLKVVLDGVRDSDQVEDSLARAGYDYKFETDELSDTQLVVVLVPFVQMSEGGNVFRKLPDRGSGVGTVPLVIALFLLLAIAFLMTPEDARAAFFGNSQ